MVTSQHSTGGSNETDTPSASELFAIIEHRLCRIVLEYFLVHDPPVSLTELVTVVEDEATFTANRRHLTIELHHNHLPRLSDCGLISYDAETSTVEETINDAAIEATLDLIA